MNKNYLCYPLMLALLLNAACVAAPTTAVSSTATLRAVPADTPKPIPSVTPTVELRLTPTRAPTLAQPTTPTSTPVSIDPAELVSISPANAQDLKPLAVLRDTEINPATLKAEIFSSVVRLLNLDAKPFLGKDKPNEPLLGFRFSQDRRRLAVMYFLSVDVWKVETGELLQTLDFPVRGVSSIAFNSSGTLLAVGETEEGGLGIFETDSGALVKSYDGPTRQIMSMAFSLDGHLFAAGGDFGEVYVWDTPTAQLRYRIAAAVEDDVNALLITSDSSRLIISSGGWRAFTSIMQVWSLETGYLIHEFEGGNFEPTLNPSESVLVSIDKADDKTSGIKLWNFSTYQLITTLPDTGASAVTFTPDGKLMLSVSEKVSEKEVTFWGITKS